MSAPLGQISAPDANVKGTLTSFFNKSKKSHVDSEMTDYVDLTADEAAAMPASGAVQGSEVTPEAPAAESAQDVAARNPEVQMVDAPGAQAGAEQAAGPTNAEVGGSLPVQPLSCQFCHANSLDPPLA
jgi:hypothetical protein